MALCCSSSLKFSFFSLFSPLADIISTVEFNHTGELLATGDKGGRVVIFQREPEVCELVLNSLLKPFLIVSSLIRSNKKNLLIISRLSEKECGRRANVFFIRSALSPVPNKNTSELQHSKLREEVVVFVLLLF